MPTNAAARPPINLTQSKTPAGKSLSAHNTASTTSSSTNDVLITYAWPAALVLIVGFVCITVIISRAMNAWAKRRDEFFRGNK